MAKSAAANAATRVHVTQDAFIAAFETSNTRAEVAAKTGLKIGSVIQRESGMRKSGIPLKRMTGLGRGNRRDVNAAIAQLAQLRGVSVESLQPKV